VSGWRCFVAVPIGAELRDALAQAVDGWRVMPEGERLRWTDPDGWHLTLVFLGSTDPERVPAIARAVEKAVAESAPFELPAGVVGAFPSPNAARVVIYRVADPDGRLAELALAIRHALQVEDGSAFRAHVTLARVRGEGRERLGEWLRSLEAPSGIITVDRAELFRSHLGRGPARYESLASIHLPQRGKVHA
jgi:RNA 2',3'-cyclic 3'-phosphodiesterase